MIVVMGLSNKVPRLLTHQFLPKLKTGTTINIPIRCLTTKYPDITMEEINEILKLHPEIKQFGILCIHTYDNKAGRMARFVIPEYHENWIKISKLKNG